MLAAGVLAIWFVTAIAAANVLRSANPALALRFVPFDAGAKAQVAFVASRLSAGEAAGADDDGLAATALLRDPTNALAARTLALRAALNQEPEQSARLFRYASVLTRRDLPTQLWLIEWYVARNDIERALHHYDAALRTSRAAAPTLFPILVAASADPAIAAPLRRLLVQKPLWWWGFVQSLIFETKAPVMAASVVRGLLDRDAPEDRILLSKLINQLISVGAVDDAWDNYRIAGGDVRNRLLRNGDFDRENPLPPFDWSLAQDVDLAAEQRPREGSENSALHLIQADGQAGEVARQLLLLKAGVYRLSATVGDTPADALSRPSIQLTCSGSTPSRLVDRTFPFAGPEGKALVIEFNVPRGCKTQSLIISVRSRTDNPTDEIWIDNIAITKGG